MIRAAILAISMVIASVEAHAQQFSTVYVFGDSLSDRGRIPGLLPPGFPIQFPVPPYFDHRFSNGPTYAEHLPGLLGVAPNPGQNFAVGGAETDTNNLANSFGLGFTLPGIRTEIDQFIAAGGRFDPKAAVVHFGGANDYFAFLNTTPTLGQVPGEVAAVTGNIRSNIQALVAAGARTIVVPNVPDLGITPSYRGTALAGVATAASEQHAAALNAQMGGLARQLGVNIYVVDFATGLKYVLANPGLFGFTNTTDACVKPSNPPIPAYVFPQTPPCANPGQHLFWDDVHPTEAGHRILAQFAADTLLAPQTIGAQAAFALTTGDSFLRRMQGAILWNGGVEHAPIFASAVVPGRYDPTKVFLNVQRTFGNASLGPNSLGFDYGTTQVSGGLTYQPSNNVTFGVIGGLDTGEADLDQARGSVGLNSFRLGAMGGYDNGALFAGTGAAISYDDYNLSRQTLVPQLHAAANTGGNTLNAFGAVGYRFNLGPVTAGPLFALRYTGIRISGYSEQGAPGLDMIVATQRADQLIGSAGIAAASQFKVGATTFVPYVNLSVENNLLSDDRIVDTALVTVPNVIRALELGEAGDVFGRVNGGVKWDLTPGIKGIIRGETTFGRDGGDEHAVFASFVGRL